MIAENLKSVRQRIERACKRAAIPPQDAKIVCVTKGRPADEIIEAIEAGVGIIGENRVQEAALKYKAIGNKTEWHLVGHLQTNKAKDAVRIFSLIHSVDSLRLAEEIDRQAGKIGKVQDILVQVNVSGEKSKFGMAPDQVPAFLNGSALYRNIRIKGLMTIAPEVDDPEKARPYFRRLRKLRDEINSLQLLSMGMSNDFEVAVEEGSNMVRIGRAIFEDV